MIKRGRRRYKKLYRNLLGNRKVGERGRRWEIKLKLIGADIKNECSCTHCYVPWWCV